MTATALDVQTVRRVGAALCAALMMLWLSGCGSPTEPDSRTGFIGLRIACDGAGTAPLICRAETYCSGLYRCPDPSADGRDVTSSAVWASADTSVARITRPGVVEGTSIGSTVITASLVQPQSQAAQTVGVFDGTVALPTNEIFGSVYEAGKTTGTGAIDGATVVIQNGLVAGKAAVSGVPPTLPPGFVGPLGGAGYYRLLGVPPGVYTIVVTKSGFASQSRSVTVLARGSPSADFPLVRE